jgi:phosphoribosylglycinamide formyltransferase-1
LKTVAHYDPDLILMLGYMRIIDSEFIERYRNRIINIHPSLLPAFQGINAHQVAIDYGVRISGATVHFVDEGTDTGPIILQAAVQVPEGADAEVLADLIRPEEHRLVVEATRLFCAGRLRVEGRRVRILASGDEEGFSA